MGEPKDKRADDGRKRRAGEHSDLHRLLKLGRGRKSQQPDEQAHGKPMPHSSETP